MPTRTLISLGLLVVSGCSYDYDVGASAESITSDVCELYGAGTLENGDQVEGAIGNDGSGVSGSWRHTTASGLVYTLTPQRIECHVDGRAIANVVGDATFEGQTEPHRFGLFVEDRILLGPEIRTLEATLRYVPRRSDDARLDDPAVVTIPSVLPVTVGNAGNGWAWLTFQRSGTLDEVTCRYRGGAATPLPDSPAELAAGAAYHLERCTGELPGTDPVDAGSEVDVQWVSLHVNGGAHRLPSPDAAQTTVTLDLEIAPLGPSPSSPRDFYALRVTNATAEIAWVTEDVVLGDLTVVRTP